MDPGHPVIEFVVIDVWIIPETHNISCTPTSNTKRESRNRLSNSRMNSTDEQHSQTNTMPYHLWHNSMTSNLTIGGQTSVLVTSIGCLVVVNTYLKMLHETIKKLLNIVLIHNLSSLSCESACTRPRVLEHVRVLSLRMLENAWDCSSMQWLSGRGQPVGGPSFLKMVHARVTRRLSHKELPSCGDRMRGLHR